MIHKYIQLIINNINLNKFESINILMLSKLNNNGFITIIFIKKQNLYCLCNCDEKYIINFIPLYI